MNTLFGTDGIRDRVGNGIFTPDRLIPLGHAIGLWAQESLGLHPTVLICTDTRASCSWIKEALITGLTTASVHVRDAGVLPTPAATHLLAHYQDIDVALVISASHNPASDNGIKLVSKKTGKLRTEDEQRITDYYHTLPTPNSATVGHTRGTCTHITDASPIYQQALQRWFSTVHLPGKRIVLDAAQGAMSALLAPLFAATGAEIMVINNQPTGTNINEKCGSTYPATLVNAVRTSGADIGFAFDGDGDRVIAVNGEGQLKDGDDLLCIALEHPEYAHTPTIVGTIMTNGGLAHHLHARNKTLVRTAVGDKHILTALAQQELLLGGEPAGHLIFYNKIKAGDGALAAFVILEALSLSHNWGLETFRKHPQYMSKIPITTKRNLAEEPFATIIATARALLTPGRLEVRYSGTEPFLRVMVEAEDAISAEQCARTITAELTKHL